MGEGSKGSQIGLISGLVDGVHEYEREQGESAGRREREERQSLTCEGG